MKMNLKNVLFIFLSAVTLCSSVFRKSKEGDQKKNGEECKKKKKFLKLFGRSSNCVEGHKCQIQDPLGEAEPNPLICREKVEIKDKCDFKIHKDVRIILGFKCGKNNEITKSIIYLNHLELYEWGDKCKSVFECPIEKLDLVGELYYAVCERQNPKDKEGICKKFKSAKSDLVNRLKNKGFYGKYDIQTKSKLEQILESEWEYAPSKEDYINPERNGFIYKEYEYDCDGNPDFMRYIY
jgi:hypothetical protein